uniref:Uncharacterized protein n=1 Tax=Peronospora matthiolae TaxID=2874970 RepID=A0AAV1UPA1_9STRA
MTLMGEGDGVLNHINKHKTLAVQVDAVGAPFSEDNFVMKLLASLSESYQFRKIASDSNADSFPWELVTSRLLHGDMKRKERVAESKEPHTVNFEHLCQETTSVKLD